jgi:beta-catenin-like protein 1
MSFKQPTTPGSKKRKVDSVSGSSSPTSKAPRLDDSSKIDTVTLKRLVTQFEKAISTNLEERQKFADDPRKFMDSEIKLDATVKQLQEQFVPHVELYGSFVKWGGVELLLSLLTHENTDIMLDVLDMISEFTEADSLKENEEEATILIKKLLEQEIISLVVSVLTERGLSDANVDEAQGIHNILSIIENLIEYDSELSVVAAQKTPLLAWCLETVIKTGEMESNQLYAAEILCVIMTNEENRTWFLNPERLEALLQRIAVSSNSFDLNFFYSTIENTNQRI